MKRFPGKVQVGSQPEVQLTRNGLWKGCFSEKVERCIDREKQPGALERAGWDEVRRLLAAAGKTMALAPTAAIRAVWEFNPDVFRVHRGNARERASGLVAILPLNEAGLDAIVTGRLEGGRPDLALIAPPGEEPKALYFWLVYLPGKLSRLLAAIGGALRDLSGAGCVIFSRAVDRQSRRLHSTIGFSGAREVYPDAPDWLLVTFPEPAARRATRRQLEIVLARSLEDMARIFAVRSSTYLAEQFCFYEEEFDGNDFCATQLLGLVDGDAAGCVRLRYFGDFAKLERLAVRKEYRKTPLAFELVRAGLRHCRRKNFTRIYGHSRSDLVPFWSRFGFRPIEGRPLFHFANLDYVEIVNQLNEDPEAIRFGGDPMVAIRPEGSWDEPGPLDRSNIAPDTERAALLEQHTRRLNT